VAIIPDAPQSIVSFLRMKPLQWLFGVVLGVFFGMGWIIYFLMGIHVSRDVEIANDLKETKAEVKAWQDAYISKVQKDEAKNEKDNKYLDSMKYKNMEILAKYKDK